MMSEAQKRRVVCRQDTRAQAADWLFNDVWPRTGYRIMRGDDGVWCVLRPARTVEEKLDELSDRQRAFIAASLDAFDKQQPADGSGVCVEDLDDSTLDTLIGECNSLGDVSVEYTSEVGRLLAPRYYLKMDERVPHGPESRTLLRLRPKG